LKVIRYYVIDPLSTVSSALATLGLRSVWYARKGEHGLLEDYLAAHGYIVDSFEEIDVEADFNQFNIILMDNVPAVDITNGRIHLTKKILEPSEN